MKLCDGNRGAQQGADLIKADRCDPIASCDGIFSLAARRQLDGFKPSSFGSRVKE
jgi:hypothetical protein